MTDLVETVAAVLGDYFDEAHVSRLRWPAEAIIRTIAATSTNPAIEYLARLNTMTDHRGDGLPTQYLHELDRDEVVAVIEGLLAKLAAMEAERT